MMEIQPPDSDTQTLKKVRDNILVKWLMRREDEALCTLIRTEVQKAVTPQEVILVDNNDVNLVVMNELMCACGFQTETIRSGKDLLQELQSRFHRNGQTTFGFPSLIIIDEEIGADDSGWFETTAVIRKMYSDSAVAIILLTSDGSEDGMLAAMGGGCTDFLVKPYKLAELAARAGLQVSTLHRDAQEIEDECNKERLMEHLPADIVDRVEQGQSFFTDELEDVTIICIQVVSDPSSLVKGRSGRRAIQNLTSMVHRIEEKLAWHGMYKLHSAGDPLVHPSPPLPPQTLCLCLCLSVSVSVSLSLCLSLSLSLCLSLSLSIYLSISLSLSLSLNPKPPQPYPTWTSVTGAPEQ